jgi:Heparinase II/III-like protein
MSRPRLSLVALIVAASALIVASSASAGSLLTKGCPPTYRAEATQPTYLPSRVDDARHGTFFLNHRLRAQIHPGMSWKTAPHHSENYLHSLYDFGWIDVLMWAYHDPKDRYSDAEQIQALREARDISWAWVQAEAAHKVLPGIAWRDRITARRAEYLAYVAKANACQGALSKKQTKGFLASLMRAARFLRNTHTDIANHKLSVEMGLAILGKQLPIGKVARAGRQATRQFHRAVHHGLDESSGVWLENSPGYFDFALRLISTWLGAVDAGDHELVNARDKMYGALAWLTSTAGTEAQLGDTFFVPPIPEIGAVAYSQNGLWVAQHAGYAVVKDQRTGSYLVVSASFHTWHHKHADDGGFELYDRNQRIVADTGAYDNTDKRYQSFARSAAAHSVLTVDGQDFLWFWHKHRDKPKPYGTGIEATGSGDGWYAILVTNPMLHRQGVTQERLFLYRPGAALIVYDSVSSDQSHRYTRYFQLGPDVTSSKQSGSGLSLTGAGSVTALTDWTDSQTGPAEVLRGQESPLAGWTYPKLRKKQPRDTVSWTTNAQSMRSAAVFALGKGQLSLGSVTGAVGGLPQIGLSDGTTLNVSRSGNTLQVSVGG